MTTAIICASALSQPLTLSREFRIIPAGRFKAIDGRPGNGASWNLSEATGQRLVAEAASRKQDYLIDYEHQSTTGETAPAAGWFNTLIWKPDGLYVQMARWTDAAKAMISANEYRFISPVFTYAKETNEVTSLLSIALTNNPALPELTDLSNVALTQQGSATGVIDNLALDKISNLLGVSLTELKESSVNTVKEKQTSGATENVSILKISNLLNLPVATLTAEKESHEKERQRANAPMSGRSLEMFNRCFPGVNPKS